MARDSRDELRVLLTPTLGPKTEADLAIEFVREDELTDGQRGAPQPAASP